jgi:hypothetical protein
MEGLTRLEARRIGHKLWILPVSVLLVIVIGSFFAGDLVDYSALSFELIYPLFTAVAVGEWCPVRRDDAIDIIGAQTTSLRHFVTIRFLVVYTAVILPSIPAILSVVRIRSESGFSHSPLMCLAPSFFLSVLALAVNTFNFENHTSSMIVGLFWMTILVTRNFIIERELHWIDLFYVFNGGWNRDEFIINRSLFILTGVVIFGWIWFRIRPVSGIGMK